MDNQEANQAANTEATPPRMPTLQLRATTAIRQFFTPLGFKGTTPAAVRCHTPSRAELRLQRFLSWLLLLPFSGTLVLLMKYKSRYRIEGMRELREQFRQLLRENDLPLVICANHLTFIDSALIIWALASKPWYFFNFRRLSWNLPAGDFFKKEIHLQTHCLSHQMHLHSSRWQQRPPIGRA